MCTLVSYDDWEVIPDDWAREPPTQQLLWGGLGLRWSKPAKHGPKKEEDEPVTGSSGPRPGGLGGPSQQTSYVSFNC